MPGINKEWVVKPYTIWQKEPTWVAAVRLNEKDWLGVAQQPQRWQHMGRRDKSVKKLEAALAEQNKATTAERNKLTGPEQEMVLADTEDLYETILAYPDREQMVEQIVTADIAIHLKDAEEQDREIEHLLEVITHVAQKFDVEPTWIKRTEKRIRRLENIVLDSFDTQVNGHARQTWLTAARWLARLGYLPDPRTSLELL